MAATPRPQSPYLTCREFHFQGMPGRTIGARPATLDDLDNIAMLAQLAYEQGDGAGHLVYQFCWNSHQENPVLVFKDGLRRALRDQNKRVYVYEDTSQEHEILAASIIILAHDHEITQSDTPEIVYGPAYARWKHYEQEMSRMRQELGTNRHVHIQELFTHPQYANIQTRDPQNPDPFLAKALFQFIYTQLEQVRFASEISAIVPAGSWLYGVLGFEPMSGGGNQRELLPPDDVPHEKFEYGTNSLDVRLLVWRRSPSA